MMTGIKKAEHCWRVKSAAAFMMPIAVIAINITYTDLFKRTADNQQADQADSPTNIGAGQLVVSIF